MSGAVITCQLKEGGRVQTKRQHTGKAWQLGAHAPVAGWPAGPGWGAGPHRADAGRGVPALGWLPPVGRQALADPPVQQQAAQVVKEEGV